MFFYFLILKLFKMNKLNLNGLGSDDKQEPNYKYLLCLVAIFLLGIIVWMLHIQSFVNLVLIICEPWIDSKAMMGSMKLLIPPIIGAITGVVLGKMLQ